jgi:diguanylate cyclase (GGDEF)-like protein
LFGAAPPPDREPPSAHTDPLTGLLNRRGLEQVLDGELGDSQEERLPLSLVVLDCDDFKDVNDRAGHEFGDALLREVGLVLRDVCPEGSSQARLGGDEFVLLLPGLESEAAVDAIDRLRRELSEGLDDAGFPLRLSAGISTYPYDGAGTTQLLRAADQALYSAKARGKNQVVSFREVVRVSGRSDQAPARVDRGRAVSDTSPTSDVMDAATAIWTEETVPDVLERLGKAIGFVVGATGSAISRVEGPNLVDLVTHALRNVELSDDNVYLISDYPVTQEVLEGPCIRSVSFLDEDLDAGEAFVLRQLGMNAAMLLPLCVDDRSWGLVEIYDMRMRRYTREDEALAGFLVAQAGRRIEALLGRSRDRRRVRRLRPPR